MKKTLLAVAALALVAFSGPVMAQDSLNQDRKGFYTGLNLGSNLDVNAKITGGIDAGYQFNKFFRAEATYDYMWRTGGNGSALMGNLVGQYKIPGTVIVPYLLAGSGMGFSSMGTLTNNVAALYNVGGGFRADLTKKLELDLRYRYVGHYDAPNSNPDQNLLTIGMNYRF